MNALCILKNDSSLISFLFVVFIGSMLHFTPSKAAPLETNKAAQLDNNLKHSSIRLQQNDFFCAGSEITVVTGLTKKYEDTGQSIFQVVAFITGGKVTEYFLEYANPQSNGSMIVQGRCIHLMDTDIVELSNTNYGNCNDCEWSDFFSHSGAYIGSTHKKFGAINFHYKTLRGTNFKKLEQSAPALNDQEWAIFINRKY